LLIYVSWDTDYTILRRRTSDILEQVRLVHSQGLRI